MADARSTFTYVLKSVTGDMERGFKKSSQSSKGLGRDLDKLERKSLDVREASLKVSMAQTRAAKATERFGKESDQARLAQIRLERQQEKLARQTTRSSRLFGSSAGMMKRAAAAGAGLAASYLSIGFAKDAVSTTEDLGKSVLTLHKSFGMSIKSAGQWAAVSKARGTEGKALTMGFKKLATSIGSVTDADKAQGEALDKLEKKNALAIRQAKEAGKSSSDLKALREKQAMAEDALAGKVSSSGKVFEKLGITQAELVKHGDDLNWVLGAVADGMKNMPNKVDAASVASKLFGRTWLTVAPLLRGGSKELQEQLALADEYGATLGGKTVEDVKKMIAAQREQKLAMLGIKVTLGSALIPLFTKASRTFADFVSGIRNGEGAGGKFADTVKDIAGPVGAMARGVASFVERNPDLAKAAASFAIISGATSKILKLTGLGGILKLGFGRGNTPVTPMFVKEVAPGAGGRGGVVPGVLSTGAKVTIASVAAGVVLPVAAMGATGFLNTSKDTAPGSLAQQFGLDRQDGATRLANSIPVAKQISGGLTALFGQSDQAALEKFGEKLNGIKGTLGSLNSAKLRELRTEAQRLREAFPKNTGLKALVTSIDAAMDEARNKIRGSWATVKASTRITMSDINRTVERNMGRVRRAMREDSQAGARALRSNINGAVTSVEAAMRRGTVSVQTGMARINELLSSELKQLGVTYLAADGKSPSIQAGALPKPSIDKQGSTGVVAPGVGEPETGGAKLDGTRTARAKRSSSGGGGGGTFAARGPAAKLRDYLSGKGFSTTSEGRSDSDTYHGLGLALDYGTSRNDLNKLSRVLWPARKQFEELFIPTWAPHGGLYHNGVKFSDAGLQADHQDHIHVAEASTFKPPEIKIPRVRMAEGLGALTVIGQAVLDKTRKAAVRYGNRRAEQGGASINVPKKLSARQRRFVATLAALSGLNPSVLGAWVWSEEGGKAHPAHGNDDNWLNVGWTDSGPVAGTRLPGWKKGPEYAAKMTYNWMQGKGAMSKAWGPASSGIRKILAAAGKGPDAQVAAIGSSGWASSGYAGRLGSTVRGMGATVPVKTSASGGKKKTPTKSMARARAIRRATSWDAKQGARIRFYESAYTIAVAKGDWTTAKMTVRAALTFWRQVRSRALAGGDGPGLTAADEQIADWSSRPTTLEQQRAAGADGGDGSSPWAASDSKLEAGYLLAHESGDKNWDQNAAIAGYNSAAMRVRQYAYGLTHGDTRVTPEMYSSAITERDTWAGRLSPANQAALGIPPTAEASTSTAMTQEERDQVLKDIRDGIKEQNDRAKLIGTTSGGVIAKAITDVVTGQIGGTVIQGVQTPLWAGTGSRY